MGLTGDFAEDEGIGSDGSFFREGRGEDVVCVWGGGVREVLQRRWILGPTDGLPKAEDVGVWGGFSRDAGVRGGGTLRDT